MHCQNDFFFRICIIYIFFVQYAQVPITSARAYFSMCEEVTFFGLKYRVTGLDDLAQVVGK